MVSPSAHEQSARGELARSGTSRPMSEPLTLGRVDDKPGRGAVEYHDLAAGEGDHRVRGEQGIGVFLADHLFEHQPPAVGVGPGGGSAAGGDDRPAGGGVDGGEVGGVAGRMASAGGQQEAAADEQHPGARGCSGRSRGVRRQRGREGWRAVVPGPSPRSAGTQGAKGVTPFPRMSAPDPFGDNMEISRCSSVPEFVLRQLPDATRIAELSGVLELSGRPRCHGRAAGAHAGAIRRCGARCHFTIGSGDRLDTRLRAGTPGVRRSVRDPGAGCRCRTSGPGGWSRACPGRRVVGRLPGAGTGRRPECRHPGGIPPIL